LRDDCNINSLAKNHVSAVYHSCAIRRGVSPKFIAELQRAKRASEAPWVRKVGNPSSRENLVMTSAYDRASVRTDSGGGGGASPDILHGHPYGKLKNCHLSLTVFCLEKSEKHSFLFAMSTNDRRG